MGENDPVDGRAYRAVVECWQEAIREIKSLKAEIDRMKHFIALHDLDGSVELSQENPAR